MIFNFLFLIKLKKGTHSCSLHLKTTFIYTPTRVRKFFLRFLRFILFLYEYNQMKIKVKMPVDDYSIIRILSCSEQTTILS